MKKFTLYRVLLLGYKNKKDNNQLGFTLTEIIVSLLIGAIVLSSALGALVSIRQIIVRDRSEANVNQRLRTAFNTIGPDIQQTGEGLVVQPTFPVLEVSSVTIPGGGGETTSQLTIRKNSQIREIFVCGAIAAGDTQINLVDTTGGTISSQCQLGTDANTDGWPDVIRRWQLRRIDGGGNQLGFIFDSASGNGEFFTYTGEQTLLAGSVAMTPTASVFPEIINFSLNSGLANNYNSGSTIIYLLEERIYRVNLTTNQLQLVVNDTDIFNLVENIAQLEVDVLLQESSSGTVHNCTIIPPPNGSCNPAYTSNYTWNQIRGVRMKIVAQPPENSFINASSAFSEEDLSLTQIFFPRNRLSF